MLTSPLTTIPSHFETQRVLCRNVSLKKTKTRVLAVISLLSTLPAFGELEILKGNRVGEIIGRVCVCITSYGENDQG